MEQLGDKIMDGFGLQCFAKTHCLPSLILLPEATCLIFALQKPINKGRGESIPDGDTPPPLWEGGRPAEHPRRHAPDQSATPGPARPGPPQAGPATAWQHGPSPLMHHETTHPTCALLRRGFLKELRVGPARPQQSQRPKPDPSFCILLQQVGNEDTY